VSETEKRPAPLVAQLSEAHAEIKRLTAALIEIRDHWATDYGNPPKSNEMYRGPYDIGVTDGHRACAAIARAALAKATA